MRFSRFNIVRPITGKHPDLDYTRKSGLVLHYYLSMVELAFSLTAFVDTTLFDSIKREIIVKYVRCNFNVQYLTRLRKHPYVYIR